MFQRFISLGVATVIWFIFGYSLCFAGSLCHGDAELVLVHTSTSFAAIASLLFVGKRRGGGKGMHSRPLVALDVFGVYGIGCLLGTVLLGVFGISAMTLPAKQTVAALGTEAYTFTSDRSLCILWIRRSL